MNNKIEKPRFTQLFVFLSFVLPFCVLGLQEAKVGFPLVPDNLATGEATNRDYHFRIQFAKKILFVFRN